MPDGAVELDYLIADAALRGRGLGSRRIAAAVQNTWSDYPSTPAVLVGVVAANTASWRALEKAGLARITEGEMSPDNPNCTVTLRRGEASTRTNPSASVPRTRSPV